MSIQTMQYSSAGRCRFISGLLALAAVILLGRAAYLQLIDKEFLLREGAARHHRNVEVAASRGMILDRNGEPIAVSSPVDSILADPRKLDQVREQLPLLASLLELELNHLQEKLDWWLEAGRHEVILKRHLPPSIAQGAINLGIEGIRIKREYRRYYPEAEVTSHLLGITDIDDQGQEGIEKVFNQPLTGVPGLKQVVQDKRGHTVEELAIVRDPQPGQDIVLSIDRRVQYYAYRALKTAVLEHRAAGGSLVLLDPHSGEILAMVNQPTANPNDGTQRKGELLRNRTVTDVFEPGSTLKPFTVAMALEQGIVGPNTVINTHPGYMRVNRRIVRDIHNYKRLTVTEVISKSSNIGVSKLALSLGKEKVWRTYAALGFGQKTGIEFPGERDGVLTNPKRWNDHALATHSFGYGLSTTAVQLAQAYAIIAADGIKHPLTLLRQSEQPQQEYRVFSAATARKLRKMMHLVVSAKGTARRAAVNGYTAAGKTGTVHKVINGGYAKDRYLSLFAGMVPAFQPRLVAVVMIDDPKGKHYYGGLVAAPVFSEVMRHAVRLLDIMPDDPLGDMQQAAIRIER